MSAAVSTLTMPGCTGPPVSNGSPPLHRETINEHCVEAAPCPHCHCRTHILQGVLTASLRNYHCTSKAQPLKGQSCSKLMLTNFTWALYFTYSPSLLTSLCIFWTSKRVTCMADKNYCRDGVFYQLCFAKENFKEKCSVDVSAETPLTSQILAFSLLHSFVAFSGPWQFCFMMKYGKSCILVSCILAEAQHYPTEMIVWLPIHSCKHMRNKKSSWKTRRFFYSFLPSGFTKIHAPSLSFSELNTCIMLVLLYNQYCEGLITFGHSGYWKKQGHPSSE